MESLAQEEALWLLGSFCTLHRVSFDPALFAQRYPPPIAVSALADAASELDLSFDQRQGGLETALSWKLPLAVTLSPTVGAAREPPS